MQNSTSSAARNLALLSGIIDRPHATLAAVLASPRWKWLLPAILALRVGPALLAAGLSFGFLHLLGRAIHRIAPHGSAPVAQSGGLRVVSLRALYNCEPPNFFSETFVVPSM
jgi:hypothetical protein